MKEATYRCDLCCKKRDANQTVGVHFTGGNWIQPKYPHECEKHLCVFCISALNSEMSRFVGFGK